MAPWIVFLVSFFAGGVSTAVSFKQNRVIPSDYEETSVYQCGLSVSTMVGTANQVGPLFSMGELSFTSIEARDYTNWLVMNSGSGVYSVPLRSTGVNRLHFRLPIGETKNWREFYLSYAHGGRLRSRYFEFAAAQPPAGHDATEYTDVIPLRARQLLPYFEYAIYETSENSLAMITDGRTDRQKWRREKVAGCTHLTKKTSALASQFKRNLDVLEVIVLGPGQNNVGGRFPASLFEMSPFK